jgi:voltage-gated potassium channel
MLTDRSPKTFETAEQIPVDYRALKRIAPTGMWVEVQARRTAFRRIRPADAEVHMVIGFNRSARTMSNRPHATAVEMEERWGVLHDLEEWLQTPMMVLSFAWLLLVIVELVWGTTRMLEVFGTAIWIIFIVEFTLRFALAPRKGSFLQRNWLTVIALVVPAFRLLRGLRFLKVARAARGFRLVRIVGTANRGMNALRASLSRRGLGYVIGLTVLIALLGAGGMLAFEPAAEVEGGFASYTDALWWTGMLLTTMGSEFWPKSLEGRILCFLLSLYGFAVFGYITASFASFFVERDAASPETDTASSGDLAALRVEIAALRADLTAGQDAARDVQLMPGTRTDPS